MSQKSGEVDYAEQALAGLGFVEKIFSFDHVPDKKLGSDVDPPLEGVIVTNTEGRQQKAYHVKSDLPPWSEQFLEDVRAGFYGQPPKGLPPDKQ